MLFLDEPFSALDYEMTLFMRERCSASSWRPHHDGARVARPRGGRVARRPRAAALAPPTRVAEIVPYDAPRKRTDATLSEPEFVRVKAHCLDVFQREVRQK